MLKSLLVALALAGSVSAHAQVLVSFKDPVGDDKGAGTYKYPTDPVYKPGSFDLTQFDVRQSGDSLSFEVTVNSNLEDPWRMGTGFSTQLVFVFIRTGQGKYVDGLPGLNLRFAAPGWDKAVIVSPESSSRVRAEVGNKAARFGQDIVVPARVKGAGRKIVATVPLASLGGGDPATWSYQVVMQSNDSFAPTNYLLVRKVNEYEGQHRFGGGSDQECDPSAIDVLAGTGSGAAEEALSQYRMLTWECGPDGSTTRPATLEMLRK